MLPPFLFDLDGTLADTLADIAASTNHVRSAHGLPALPGAVVRTFVGDGARTLLARALHEALPPDGAARERALDRAFAAYAEHHQVQCTGHATLYPGALAHLRALHDQGHRLAVVTNKPERFAVPLVAHLGLGDLVRVVLGGDSLPVKKPDPGPLHEALRQLGHQGPGATMVGDGVQDLRAGKAAGCRTIACLFGFGEPTTLRAEGADVYWRAFGELV
jgi:phosphoglycolate phosphatase